MTTFVTLTWQSYEGASFSDLATHTVPIPAEHADDLVRHFASVPGVRNPRIEARTVELGDVPAPRYGWTEPERHDVPEFPAPRAALAVACPKCKQPGGGHCESTGGGNRQSVATHKARLDRVAGWSNAVQEHAEMLMKTIGHHGYLLADLFGAFEAAAAPIPAKGARKATPKGVQLSEKGAEFIEYAALAGGYLSAPLSHFHGEAQIRQTVNALEAKGIVAEVSRDAAGYDRTMKLTEFGWAVYDQHRLIIKRLTDEQVAEQRRRAEEGRCTSCGAQPGQGPQECGSCDLDRREEARQ